MLPDCGIYVIECLANGKRYVGQAQNMRTRVAGHKRELSRRRHPNRNLQASWNKYGPSRFAFRPVLVARPSELALYEQLVADFYRPDGLFNYGLFLDNGKRGIKLGSRARARIKAGVNTPVARQKKVDALNATFSKPEVRKNLSDGCKRNWKDNEARRQRASKAVSKARNDPDCAPTWNAAIKAGHNTPEYLAKMTGRKRTPETKAKMSTARNDPAKKAAWDAAIKASRNTPEFRAKVRGRKHTPEACANMSAARRGLKQTPEAIAKSAEARRGRKNTPEAIAKMSEIARRRIRSPEAVAKMTEQLRLARAKKLALASV